jgi:RNA polymerase sigma factor (sigma-70 family)
VTQAVFMTLARKAASVPADRPLSGWLLKVTSYAAANARRAARIRQTHEREAADMARSILAAKESDATADWDDLWPLLDEGIGKLKSGERDALLLKYFDRKPLHEVGARLGISEAAAAKRVSRAVERLRKFFRRRGVSVSSVALAGVLTTRSVEAAPASLSATSTAAALAGPGAAATSASAAAITQGVILAMATAKTKSAVLAIVAILLLLAGGGSLMHIMTASNERRTIAAPVPAVATPVLSNPAWQASFPDGSVVDVVAMSERPDDPTAAWWTPDGANAARPNAGRSSAFVSGTPDQRTVCFVLRLTGPATADANVNVEFMGETGAAGLSQNVIGGVRWVKYVMAVSPDQTRGDLEVLVSSGAYKQVQRIPIHTAAASSAPVTNGAPATPATTNAVESAPRSGDLVVRGVGEEKGKAVIQIVRNGTDPDGPQDEQIVALLANGKEITYTMMQSNTFGLPSYYFNAKPRDITALIRRTRSFATREIRNVALTPAAKPG